MTHSMQNLLLKPFYLKKQEKFSDSLISHDARFTTGTKLFISIEIVDLSCAIQHIIDIGEIVEMVKTVLRMKLNKMEEVVSLRKNKIWK